MTTTAPTITDTDAYAILEHVMPICLLLQQYRGVSSEEMAEVSAHIAIRLMDDITNATVEEMADAFTAFFGGDIDTDFICAYLDDLDEIQEIPGLTEAYVMIRNDAQLMLVQRQLDQHLAGVGC